MTRQRMAVAGMVWIAVMAAAVAPAFAGDYYDVILANKLVLRLRDPGPTESLTTRSSQVEKNIVEALSVENVRTPKMWIEVGDDDVPAIFIGETFLVEVLEGDLAGKDMTAKDLAKQWMAAFAQQFPRAEPVTGGGKAGKSNGGGRATGPKEVNIPDADREIVAKVLDALAKSRDIEDEAFEGSLNELAAKLATTVWRSGGEVHCDSVTEVPGAEVAIKSALNGLRFAHGAADAQFDAQKTLVAYTIVKRVRQALTPVG